MTDAMSGSFLAGFLLAYRFSCSNEDEVQVSIAQLFDAAAIEYERERRIGLKDRVDFVVAPGIALEVKTQGAPADVLRQLQRYAAHDLISELVLVTTVAKHRSLPACISGKGLVVVHLSAGAIL
jgi:hypothetical protein